MQLGARDAQKFRSVAARVNCVAQNRPDLQYASRTVAQHMSDPTSESMAMLKRIGRSSRSSTMCSPFSAGVPRMGL